MALLILFGFVAGAGQALAHFVGGDQFLVHHGGDVVAGADAGSKLEKARKLGIEIIDVRLKRVDLPQEVSDSVYRRMEAERKRVANELRSTGAAEGEKIRADADRQRQVIVAEAYREAQKVKGEGDAKASAIFAEAFGRDPQFAQFYRSLEAYRSAFRTKGDVMVLDPASDFFRAMRGSSSAAAAPAAAPTPGKK